MSAPLPVLTVAVRQSAQSLTLACKVRAPTSVDYGVFHRIVDFYPDGAYRLSADTAYIEVVGDTLRIEKSCLAIPKELQVAEKSLPWAVKVPAGVEWEEEIRLTLPVRVCHPYRRAILAGKNPGADVNPEEPKTIRKI